MLVEYITIWIGLRQLVVWLEVNFSECNVHNLITFSKEWLNILRKILICFLAKTDWYHSHVCMLNMKRWQLAKHSNKKQREGKQHPCIQEIISLITSQKKMQFNEMVKQNTTCSLMRFKGVGPQILLPEKVRLAVSSICVKLGSCCL